MQLRRQRQGILRLMAMLAVMAMLVAACSGGDADSETTVTTAAPDTSETTEAPDTGDTTATTEAMMEDGGTLEVALLADISNFDPMAFSAVNFTLIKNLYDSLIEYTPEGEPIPNVATAWEIADDNTSVTLTLRDDIVFHSGNALTSESVAGTLEKAADPELGRNLFSTMSIVEDWETPDDTTVTINFNRPVAEKQITDLLQFISVIDPAGIENIDNEPAGSGPFMLESRELGQSVTLVANPNYWQEGPYLDAIHQTVFDDADAASAALESGDVDMIYNVSGREGKRLSESGFNLVEGPGPLVQVLRLNPNRGTIQNQTFRQGLAYILNREAILEVGYAGIGVVTALPWAPNNAAADPSYNETYAYNPEKAREIFDSTGMSEAEMEDWKLLVNSGSQDTVAISQLLQADLAAIGIDIELDLLEGAEYTDRILGGEFDAVFAGIGNVQKFPSRVATNSIFRTADNPVVGEPMFPAYVEAIERVDSTLGPEAEIQAAYDNLNEVIMDLAFALPTNTWQFGLMIVSPDVSGITLDIDNMLIGRTLKKSS